MAAKDISDQSFVVYRLTCTPTGKAYIGITCDLRRRWNDHVSSALRRDRGKHILSRGIRKYGRDNFAVETLYEASSRKEAEIVERGLIASYRTLMPHGFNMTCGGEGTVGYRKKHSKETREKIGLGNRGRIVSAETRAKQSAARKGRKLPPEWCAALSASRRGLHRSAETKAKISAAHKGKKLPHTGLSLMKRYLAECDGSRPSRGIIQYSPNVWVARTTIKGERFVIGRFASPTAAQEAYAKYITVRIAELQKTLPDENP